VLIRFRISVKHDELINVIKVITLKYLVVIAHELQESSLAICENVNVVGNNSRLVDHVHAAPESTNTPVQHELGIAGEAVLNSNTIRIRW
jgi:hypothetical protein